MRFSFAFPTLALSLATALTGCIIITDPVDGQPALNLTDLLLTASSRGDGTTKIDACAHVSPNMVCDSEGKFIARSADQEVTLANQENSSEVSILRGQIGELEGDEEGREIVVSYEGLVEAPETRVALPAPFTLAGPEDGATFTHEEEVLLTWEPASDGDRMAWQYEGTCTDAEGKEKEVSNHTLLTGDPGELRLHGELLALPADESCAITLEIVRERAGTVDPAFGRGTAVGQQLRAVSLVIGTSAAPDAQ